MFLILSGGVHAVEIQADFSPGNHFGVVRQGGEMVQGSFRARLGVVGTNPRRCKKVRMPIGQRHRPVRGAPINADNQHPMDFGCGGAMQHIHKISIKGVITQVAVTIKRFHFLS